ncbi:MAG: prepilin-type N-terminal cleavage/methylation domain-containing protein, partial [Bdellovibrionales bacterium]|nr:prepilin-type N-terminal cleavage/methylation domain-containing protein [Bdellovibrionales bacterium]
MRNSRGFTILEFVIAMAIIAIILVSVYASQGFSLASSSRLKSTQVATNLARTLLHE